MRITHLFLYTVAALFAGGHPLAAQTTDTHWPQFRGPGARGVAANPNLPERWSATENVAWKAEIPGRAWSSPVVWGDRVFLTTAVSPEEVETVKKGLYLGGERPNAPRPAHEYRVLCLDLIQGKTIWERTVHQGAPGGPTHLKNSRASETPVTDGERVYACFGNLGIYCLDFAGQPVWSAPLPPRRTRNGWGPAASPALYRDRIYYVSDNEEQSSMVALDKHTGKEVWRVNRDEKSNWATPYVWENDRGVEIVTPGTGQVRSYDLEGKLRWWLHGMSSITIATPYADQNLLYVSSGFIMDISRPLYAIRPGGTGEITLPFGLTNSAAIAWCNPTAAPYNPSTLVYDGRLYVLYDRGSASAFDARTGAPLYTQAKLPDGLHFTASPWAYGQRVFCLNEDGVTFVLRAGDRFELLRTNKLAEDDLCLATPAMAGDRLLIRTAVRLYCIKK